MAEYGQIVHARTVPFALLVLAACGTPAADVASPVTESTTSDSADVAPSSSGPITSTSTSTTLAAAPRLSLRLCGDIPLLAPSLIGSNPPGNLFDPVFDGVLLTYSLEHVSTFGGMWFDQSAGGITVLAFTDDPAAHRAELALRRPSPDDVHPIDPMPPITDERPIGEWGIPFDVVQVAYTETELIDGVDVVLDAALALGLPMDGAGVDTRRNRVNLVPSLPLTMEEAQAIESAVAAVAPLEMVCVEGAIVASRPDPIAPGSALDVIALPDQDGNYPADTEVRCGELEFRLDDLQSMAPIEEADPQLKSVVAQWVNGPGATGWPTNGWLVLTQTDETATMIHFQRDAIYSIGAERGPNGWTWSRATGSGACDVARRLPQGMGNVSWTVDPAFAVPDATTTEVHLLAVESGCTGGSTMGERLLGPQVVETDDSVRIVLASIPLVGAQNCPGNPPSEVTVTLERPLGNRALIDGLVIAPLGDLVPPSP